MKSYPLQHTDFFQSLVIEPRSREVTDRLTPKGLKIEGC